MDRCRTLECLNKPSFNYYDGWLKRSPNPCHYRFGNCRSRSLSPIEHISSHQTYPQANIITIMSTQFRRISHTKETISMEYRCGTSQFILVSLNHGNHGELEEKSLHIHGGKIDPNFCTRP